MAKFNIEVELDWMDEEAYSIDDELRERIVKGVENAPVCCFQCLTGNIFSEIISDKSFYLCHSVLRSCFF